MRVECLTCRGVYNTDLPDGTRYFHACPPLPAFGGAPSRPRPDARNENIDRAKVRRGDSSQPDEDRIIAVGRGVRRVP